MAPLARFVIRNRLIRRESAFLSLCRDKRRWDDPLFYETRERRWCSPYAALQPITPGPASTFDCGMEGGTQAAELSRVQSRTIESVAGPHGIILVLFVNVSASYHHMNGLCLTVSTTGMDRDETEPA